MKGCSCVSKTEFKYGCLLHPAISLEDKEHEDQREAMIERESNPDAARYIVPDTL
jgi:hypothetical protein